MTKWVSFFFQNYSIFLNGFLSDIFCIYFPCLTHPLTKHTYGCWKSGQLWCSFHFHQKQNVKQRNHENWKSHCDWRWFHFHHKQSHMFLKSLNSRFVDSTCCWKINTEKQLEFEFPTSLGKGKSREVGRKIGKKNHCWKRKETWKSVVYKYNITAAFLLILVRKHGVSSEGLPSSPSCNFHHNSPVEWAYNRWDLWKILFFVFQTKYDSNFFTKY